MAKQVFHQPKRREIAKDLSNVQFNPTSASAGASLPRLQTNTTTRQQTNSIMESFASFSKSMNNLLAIREKNDAAQEAIDAKNAALAGEYRPFDRQASLDIYDSTRGAIDGREALDSLSGDIEKIHSDILNQGKDLETSLTMWDEAKSDLVKDQHSYGLDQSEAYKSGFLPFLVKGLETGRETLAKKHHENFIASTKEKQSTYVGQVVTDHVASNPLTTGLPIESFDSIVNSGMLMGLEANDARENAIDTIGQIAVNTNNPWLFDFAEQKSKSTGFKLSSNAELYKKVLAYQSKAETRFSAEAEKTQKKLDKLKKETAEAAVQAETNLFLEDPDEYDMDTGLARMKEVGSVKASQTQTFVNFVDSVRKNGKDIVRDINTYVNAHSKLIAGDWNKDDLDQLAIESADKKRGITLTDYRDLYSVWEKRRSIVNGNNAFTIGNEQVESMFGSDEYILSLQDKDIKPYGVNSKAQLINVKASAIATMKHAMLYFTNSGRYKGKSLDSPEARAFVQQVISAIDNKVKTDANPYKDIQVELSDLGIGFDDSGEIDKKTIDRKMTWQDPPGAGWFTPKEQRLPLELQNKLYGSDPNKPFQGLVAMYRLRKLEVDENRKKKSYNKFLNTIEDWYVGKSGRNK